MKQSYYAQDDNKAICDICARAYKQSQLRMQWDYAMACYRCYDSKHPDLEPIIPPSEDPMVYDARPRPSFDNLTFVDEPGLSVWGGVMNNGSDYGTEWIWDDMNIDWDETPQDDFR